MNYCKAVIEDRVIFFSLTNEQMYSSPESSIPIYWEVQGEVFVGELSLEDISTLDIQSE
jgi:hypothetical protein